LSGIEEILIRNYIISPSNARKKKGEKDEKRKEK
jgi:hypothetical protein